MGCSPTARQACGCCLAALQAPRLRPCCATPLLLSPPCPPADWLPLQDIVHLDAFGKRGELLYCLGHEVRSLHHPSFMRPLYNRRVY
jgi:hypothetical protein